MINNLIIFNPVQPVKVVLFVAFAILLCAIMIWDIRTYNKRNGYIPSYLTTLALLIAVIFAGKEGLFTGAVMFVLGYLLFEIDLYRGEADLKIFTAIGLVLGWTGALVFLFALALVTILLHYVWKLWYKENKEIPFIPHLAISFYIVSAMLIFV